jgi:PTS system nitrogen regulatory IIA component
MPQRDYTLEELSQYLHLAPPQILKLAERRQLPGRKVGGQWQFPKAEIHHWLEERLGAGGDAELTHVEQVLERAPGGEESLTIASLLVPEAIALPLAARTKNSVIAGMVALAERTGWLWDAPRLEEAVRARENLHSTALDIGVALLHPRRPQSDMLAQSFLALGRTGTGIPFGTTRGQLTDVFFLICSLDDASHLRILARLSRLLLQGELLMLIRHANHGGELLAAMTELEARVFET